MKNKLRETDVFAVYNDFSAYTYLKELNLLYLPLIGSTAVKLYEYLSTKILVNNNITKNFLHFDLIDNIGVNLKQIVFARKKLEAIGLLETYFYEKDNKNYYIYKILAPLSFVEFFRNPMLSSLLENSIASDEYKLIYTNYAGDRVDFSILKNVTSKFHQVFGDNDVDEFSSLPTTNYGPNLDDHYFDITKLRYILSNKYLDILLDDDKLREDVIALAHLYKPSPEIMANAIEKSIDESSAGTSVNINALKDYFIQLYVNIKKQEPKTLDKMVNQMLLKEAYQEDRKLSEREQLAQTMDTMNYVDFIYKKYGIRLSEIDSRNTIMKIQEKYNFNAGVLNVLLDYAISQSGEKKIPHFNYIDKIASSWSSTLLITALDAMDFVAKQRENFKNKTSHTKVRTSNQKRQVNTPEHIKEQLKDFNDSQNQRGKTTNIDKETQEKFEKLLKEKGIN